MPYDFALDYLYPLQTSVKKMFGNYAIYCQGKIYLATRLNEKNVNDNGIWIGTSFEHQKSLKEQFPSLCSLNTYNIKKWLLLPVTAEDFEETAIQICELIKSGDERIGV